jgi:hypothetical protein
MNFGEYILLKTLSLIMTKERLFILIRRFFFEYFSQNFLFKAQDNFQSIMIIPFRITHDFFHKQDDWI